MRASLYFLVDVINDLEFVGGDELLTDALPVARNIASLKRRAKLAGIPAIYVNDNVGFLLDQPGTSLKTSGCGNFDPDRIDMRDYHLVIPGDCVASQDENENTRALAFMQRVPEADIRPSTEINLKGLRTQDE